MEKTYTLTIRDLSNEAENIQYLNEKINYLKEGLEKTIEIKGHSHIQAIASFLKHQQEEIKKIGIMISVKTEYLSLAIDPMNIRLDANGIQFIYKDNTFKEYGGIKSIEEMEENYKTMTLLLKGWEKLKRYFFITLETKYQEVKRSKENTIQDLKEIQELYENFKV